ncbi:hypothetical protein [Moorena sp. SIO4G3]|uniref:hypothetical protein n=1 Tax=Moorena sp. SIO4G3 TaxID=2607821 RepID=UPI00142A248D|nr:hypothetical protein [Moorena sp. SIO4G3]NEO76512.1 hypothetical protein [Moorena sp. SIO4G3]
MPIDNLPEIVLQGGQSVNYYLVAFDQYGNEQERGEMSQKLVEILANEPITDVFIFSHGWMGDVPAARHQYRNWLTAIAVQKTDLAKMEQVRSGFKSLFIGLHWPSLPWGDENLEQAVSFDATSGTPMENLINQYQRIADTEVAKQPLQTILSAAMEDMEPPELPSNVREAYEELNQLSGLGHDGEGAAPGNDREPFDPEQIYQAFEEEFADESFDFGSGYSLRGLLAPLRILSFWKMKERARQFGESGGSQLLKQLQEAAPENVRFHLKGHSFGCIVVSAILAGKGGKGELVRPVNSLALLQGALSFWSYCSEIPVISDKKPGYFHSIIAEGRVAGPIITTQSEYDTAVGKMYPLGAGVVLSEVDFAPGQLPKYGALGTFGARGLGLDIVDLEMLPQDIAYSFEAGKVYNIESSKYICKHLPNAGLAGSHSDIFKPVVAHAVLGAAIGQ